jgi:PAS domain S-box-containing protein
MDLLLAHDLPMVALLGPDLIQVYNDRYRDLMGSKHPAGLGQPTQECWPEVWHINEPIYRQVFAGETLTFEDKLYPITRHGHPEEAWFTLTYSPLRDGAGEVDGVLVTVIETSAKIRAEAARRESERRLDEVTRLAGLSADFRALFEAAPTPLLVLTTPDLTIVAVNDAYLRATMTERATLLGQRVFDAFPDDPADPSADGVRSLPASLERVLGTGQADAMPVQRYPIRRPPGAGGGFEERWWSPLNSPVPGPDGNVALIIHRAEDVTAARRAEAALRESEAQFRLAANAVPQIVWITDAEGRVEFFNRVWTDYTGAAYEPTTAAQVAASFVHPDDGPATIAAFEEARRTGTTLEVEHRIRSRSGRYRWFLVRAEPYRDPETGAIIRWFGSSTDIHDRRGTEARLAALVALGDQLREVREHGDVPAIVAEVIGRALAGLRAGYGTLDADEAVVTFTHDWAAPGIPSVVGEWPLAEYWAGFADAMRRGEVVAITDAASDPRTRAVAANYAAVGVRGVLHVPLVADGRVAALVFVHDANPRAWSGEEVAFVRGVAERAWAAAERLRAEARQTLLAREVDHRAKNALSVVLAALRLTRALDVGSFQHAIEGRVAALARAQTLLAEDRWTGADLETMLRGELAPFLSADDARRPKALLTGPRIILPTHAAQPLAMALHELATNAVKHGALSVAAGRLTISWRLEAGPPRMLHLRWTEVGGPPVLGSPDRKGFGTRVLQGTVRDQLGGTVTLTWADPGPVCDIAVPLQHRARV